MPSDIDSLDDSFADPGVPPPPDWLRQAMEEGLAAMQTGMTQIQPVERATLPPRATLPSAAPKPPSAAPQPQRPPRDPVSQMRRLAKKAAMEPSTTASASKEDFEEFSQSMQEAHPATVAHSPVPQADVAVGAAGKAQFRADWVPTISENLVEAKAKPASASPPEKKPDPVPAKGAATPAPAPAPVAVPAPAPTPAPAPRVVFHQETQADRTARKTFFWISIFVYVLSMAVSAYASLKSGFSPIPALAGFGVFLLIQLPFLILFLMGKRWAGYAILAMTVLLSAVTLVGMVALKSMGPYFETNFNFSIPQIPIWSVGQNIAWLIGTILLVTGKQSNQRTGIAAVLLGLSAILMVPGAFTDRTVRLANPITGPAEANLGDPARGFSFKKPKGFSGFRWDGSARDTLLLTAHRNIPATEIFIAEGYDLAFFYHLSEDAPDDDNVSASLAEFFDGAEFLGRDGFELNGATYRSARFVFPADMVTPVICATTTSTELEEGWLHVTVLAYEARFGSADAAQEAAQATLEHLLGKFDVSTPPP